MAKLSGDKAVEELNVLIDELENVRKKPRMSAKFKKWQRDTEDMLAKIFGRNSKQAKDFNAIRYNLAAFSNQTPESAFDEAFQQGLKNAAITLASAIKELKKPPPSANKATTNTKPVAPDKGKPGNSVSSEKLSSLQQAVAQATQQSMRNSNDAQVDTRNQKIPTPSTQAAPIVKPAETSSTVTASVAKTENKAYLLYAYDSDLQEEISSFLSKVGITPVILQDQPSHKGKLAASLTAYTDVSYAIVVLDPGHGGLTQEMVFDLGVIVGRIGNDCICGLAMGTMIDLPAFAGISYVPYDGMGAWKFMLIKQLKSAGFDVDANLAL